jgi:hypothetical protein
LGNGTPGLNANRYRGIGNEAARVRSSGGLPTPYFARRGKSLLIVRKCAPFEKIFHIRHRLNHFTSIDIPSCGDLAAAAQRAKAERFAFVAGKHGASDMPRRTALAGIKSIVWSGDLERENINSDINDIDRYLAPNPTPLPDPQHYMALSLRMA